MADTILLAVDKLKRGEREDLFLKLLTYAGPPVEGKYVEWCKVVERGCVIMMPHWGEVDVLDATIQFRHWCCKRGAKQRRKEKIDSLLERMSKLWRLS